MFSIFKLSLSYNAITATTKLITSRTVDAARLSAALLSGFVVLADFVVLSVLWEVLFAGVFVVSLIDRVVA
jgi:hypothetical protein